MSTDLTSPDVIRTFGHNLDTCLRLIGSRPESLALRCNISLDLILGFEQGEGELNERLLTAICRDISVPKEQLLLAHRSPVAAERYFEGVFREKGRLTASNLIGTNETKGEEVMPVQLELSQGRLNDPEFRTNFGLNVRVCLNHIGRTAASLALRAEMPENNVNLLLEGRFSLSNDDIEAIRLEIGLHTNDLIMDYINDNRRNEMLLAKLSAAGRIKIPEPVVEVQPEPELLTTAVALPAVAEEETTQEEAAVESAATTSTTTAEMPQTMETTAMADIWDSNDVIASINGRTFNLRDREYRKIIGERIIALKNEKRPEDGWTDILNKCHMIRAANWIHNVSYGSAAISGTEVESFAEFFGVSVLSVLTGQMGEDAGEVLVPEQTSVVDEVAGEALAPERTTEVVNLPEHDVNWSSDGFSATDAITGRTFDLMDEDFSLEVANRIRRLCPADTAIVQILETSGINETSNWFEAVEAGSQNMHDGHIQAFAEFFAISEFALLSGEGLDLPDEVTDEEDSAAHLAMPVSTAAPPEAATAPTETIVSATETPANNIAEEGPAAVSTEAEPFFPTLEADIKRRLSVEEYFRQRLLSSEFDLVDGVTLRAFLEATQAPTVDWCNVYYTMTKEGVETLQQMVSFAQRFEAGDTTLNMQILTHVLSTALKR